MRIEVVPNSDKSFKLEMKAGELEKNVVVSAAKNVNQKLKGATKSNLIKNLDVYEIIDLRMLSGMIGEMLSTEICNLDGRLIKNPNIDGYPDLCDISLPRIKRESLTYNLDEYLSYKYGGFEVKNTFGVKKPGVHIQNRKMRLPYIQRKLVWKAHHRETNHLIALHSDYIDGIPQIVAGYYSGDLSEKDWTIKQQPKEGSTMTSFCQTTTSAFSKLKSGIIFYMKGINYEEFIK